MKQQQQNINNNNNNNNSIWSWQGGRSSASSLFSGFVSIISIDCIFQSYWIAPTPSNSLFAPLPSHWILRRVLTDRVTRMAKMKRTRKGGLNLFDKIFPECFVRFKGGEQQRYKAKIQPRNRMDSLSSSLAFSFHEPCHFMTVLFLFTSDSVPSDSK